MKKFIVILFLFIINGCHYDPGSGINCLGLNVGSNQWIGIKTNQMSPLKSAFNSYKKEKGKKAFALAYTYGGNWAVGYSTEYESQEKANEYALDRCEKGRLSRRIPTQCQIVAVGDKVILHKEIFE